MSDKVGTKNYAVTYTIDYVHRVMVGIKAVDEKTALALAATAFEDGSLWDNTQGMPILFDDFEEPEQETLHFSCQEISEFPAPDASVLGSQTKVFAMSSCQALLEGDYGLALKYAAKALPNFNGNADQENEWQDNSGNGCDLSGIVATCPEGELSDALSAIGWKLRINQEQTNY